MKLVRILLAILGLLIVICIFAIGSVVLFVDPNKLKPVIIKEIAQQSNYQATIEGSLSWFFYPYVGVRIQHMTLRAKDQTTIFLDLRDIKIATELKQLIHGNKELTGDVNIAAVRLANLQIEKVHVGIGWQNKVLTLAPMTAQLYNGSLAGVAHGSRLDSDPNWDLKIAANHIEIAPLLADVNGANSKLKLSGWGQAKLDITTAGKTPKQILSRLNGSGDFNLSDGVVTGIDLNYLVQTADAILTHDKIAVASNTNQTGFKNLTTSFQIKNGIASTNNLLLTSTNFTTKGEGSIDLPSQKIDLGLQTAPLNTQKQWLIPIIVSGDLQSPSVRLDLAALKTEIARDQLEKVGKKVQEELKKLPGEADKFLKNLLGN